MTAYSTVSYTQREDERRSRQTPLVTIRHGHPLNNPHRAPFMSGSSAARALFEYARQELSDPVRGKDYFSNLRKEFTSAALDGEALRKRLQRRQARAARALASSDLELSADQLVLSAELSRLQGLIAERLIPNILAAGADPEAVIGVVDEVTRRALASTAELSAQRSAGLEESPIIEWQGELETLFANARERTGETSPEAADRDKALLRDFDIAINQLERTIPDSIERPEPLWEIDEIPLDPDTINLTSKRLAAAMGDEPSPDGLSIEDRAKQAIWRTMSKAERIALATQISLSSQERTEFGLNIVNSTPPIVRLPEASLTTGRFDVRMSTVEEATVLEALLQWAGDQPAYPGPEASVAMLDAMRGGVTQTALSEVQTYALVVDETAAGLAHAKTFIEQVPSDSRLLLFASTDSVRAELVQAREDKLREEGINRPVLGSDDATRAYGGWSLPGNSDRVLGAGPNDQDIIVAISDAVFAFTDRPVLDPTSLERLNRAVRSSEANLENAEAALDQETNLIAAQFGPENEAEIKTLLGLITRGGYSPERFTQVVETARGGTNSRAAINEIRDVTGIEQEKLAKALAVVTSSETGKLRPELTGRLKLLRNRRLSRNEAARLVLRNETQREKALKQDRALAFRRAGEGSIARANIISNAWRLGTLTSVYMPATASDRQTVETQHGKLAKVAPLDAARAANLLLDGADYGAKQIRDALSAGIGSRYDGRAAVMSTLFAASNWYTPSRGAKQGLDELTARLSLLPEQGVVLIDDNAKNPASQAALKWSQENGRPVINAYAWRIVDKIENSMDRSTKLDLGYVVTKGSSGEQGGERAATARPREFTATDLQRSTVVISGGGHMEGSTWDAIQAYLKANPAEAAKNAAEGMSGGRAIALVHKINQELGKNLPSPDLAGPQKAAAIMREALVDFADQAIIGSDLRDDWHSANLIRLAKETGKISAVLDMKGAPVTTEVAFEHSLKFAKSIAETTLDSMQSQLETSTKSNFGQVVLSGLPGINAEQARDLGEVFDTLGQIQQVAKAELADPKNAEMIPHSLRAPLATPIAWANAISRAEELGAYASENRVSIMTASDPAYPKDVAARAHSPVLFIAERDAEKDKALAQPALALVTGERSRPTEIDVAAIEAVARDAAAKSWSVAIHLNGELAAKAIETVANMDKEERPSLVVITDSAVTRDKYQTSAEMVANGDLGAVISTTPPLPSPQTSREDLANGDYKLTENRDRARELLGEISAGVVVVKADSRDPALLSMKKALEHGVPVAAVSNPHDRDGKVFNMNWAGQDYAANRKLVTKAAHFEVTTSKRHLAFTPNSIPDMTAEVTAQVGRFGDIDRQARATREELDASTARVESGSRVISRIDFVAPVPAIGAGRSAGDFIDAVTAGSIGRQQATEADLAARARENDSRFLDTAARDTVSSEIRETFNELAERSSDHIAKDASANLSITAADEARYQQAMAASQGRGGHSR